MFELLDVKWGTPTYGVSGGTVTWSNEGLGALSTGAGTSTSDLDSALAAAFQRWEDVAAIDFEQVASGGSIAVSTTAFSGLTAGLAGIFSAGLTSDPDRITSATIDFDSSSRIWADENTGGQTNFFTVALHEIGHTLGLNHPLTDDPSQIMNATISGSIADLSDTDIAGAQFIYGTDGSDVPVDIDRGDGDGGSGGGGAIGLLLGLLALISTLFSGGAGAVVAMAAGRVADNDGDDNVADDVLANAHVHDEHCGHFIGEDGGMYAEVYMAEGAFDEVTGLPLVDMMQRPNPCGCHGVCEHIVNDGDMACETVA